MKKFLIRREKEYPTVKEAKAKVEELKAMTVDGNLILQALKAGKAQAYDGWKPDIQYEIAELDKAIKAGKTEFPKYRSVLLVGGDQDGKGAKTVRTDKYIVSFDELVEEDGFDTKIYILGEGERSKLKTVEDFKLDMDKKANDWTNENTN